MRKKYPSKSWCVVFELRRRAIFFSAGRRGKPFLSADKSFSRPFWNHQNSIIQFYHPWFKIHPGGLRFRTAFDNGTSGFFAFKGVWGRYVYVRWHKVTEGFITSVVPRPQSMSWVWGMSMFLRRYFVYWWAAGGGRLVWLCLCHWRILERRVILFFSSSGWRWSICFFCFILLKNFCGVLLGWTIHILGISITAATRSWYFTCHDFLGARVKMCVIW